MTVETDPRIGTKIAGYRIEALIGCGGMSTVYRAEDLTLERKVALKLISPELSEDENFRERFRAEWRLAASIDHPNVIPIHEAGESNGTLFIAMRYVEGTDLKALLKEEGALEPARAWSLTSQAADGLDAAHKGGLIHRDVKPSNVLIARDDEKEHAYLADFGLTKPASSAAEARVSIELSGTTDYVSPEQITDGTAEKASDIYSLGALLYESLTGEVPFPRERKLQVLFAHVNDPPPKPTEIRPELPEAIGDVIAKALAKDPAERYGSGRELCAAARSALGLAEPVRTTWWRTPLLVALAGIAVLAVALTAFLLTRDGELAAFPPIQVDSVVRIDPATNELAATIPVGEGPSDLATDERLVWVANFDEGTVSQIDPTKNTATAIRVSGSPVGIAAGEGALWATSTLEGDTRLTKIDAGRGALLREVDLGPGLGVVTAGGGAVWVAVNDLADYALVRLSPGTGEVAATIPLPGRPGDVAFGEDALWVGSGGLERALWRIDPRRNELVATIELSFPPEDIATGEGAVWVSNRGDGSISRIDPAANRVVETVRSGGGAAGVAVGDGTVWVANSVARTVSRIDPGTGDVVATIDVGARPEDVAAGAGGVWVSVLAD